MLVCAPLDNVEGSLAWKPRQAGHQVSATTTAHTCTPKTVQKPYQANGQVRQTTQRRTDLGPTADQRSALHGQSSPSKYGRGEQKPENNL